MNYRNRSRGALSVYALLTTFLLIGTMLGVAGVAGSNLVRARQDRGAWAAFQAAQAGLELETGRQLRALETENDRFEEAQRSIDEDLQLIAPGATGTTTVNPIGDGRSAWITSDVTLDGVRRSVRTRVRGKNLGIWNNAIFAGTGAAGQSINGNVNIRGSVHILGEGEAYSDLNGNGTYDTAETYSDKNKNGVWDPGEAFVDRNGDGVWNSAEPYNDTNLNGIYDPPLTQTDLNSDMTGTAYVGNNYSNMPAVLEALVPAIERMDGIETLNAELRCQHGRVSIGGNAKIGTDAVIDGGTSKSTVDGVYVSDGFTGTQGAASVYSDNGTSNSYDLGHLDIDFPIVQGLGAQTYKDTSGTNWSTQEAYLNARSLTVPVTSITATTDAFSYGPDAYGNRMTFTPASGTNPAILRVEGIVKVGSIQIGANDTIRFEGVGTIYSTGSINVDGNFLPKAGKIFPDDTTIGMIALKNLNLATGAGSSQLQMCGAFYAQGRITSRKQNEIAGTFVSNFFDMGTNVPSIYQVPELVNNMPPGMPGNQPIISLTSVSWRVR